MILLASVIAPHKMSEPYALMWLSHFDAMRDSVNGHISVFLAAEIDSRGLSVYEPIFSRLHEVGATIWTFALDKRPFDDEPYEVTTPDRLIRICMGRNLGIEVAMGVGASHVLWLDTDTEPTADCLPKLLEVDRALVFGHVPTYTLTGPRIPGLPGDCRAHWSSAGFCLVRRDVIRHVRWGWDSDGWDEQSVLTDDPTFARDVELMGRALGQDWSPVTRHDVEGKHWPPSIVALEHRPVDRLLR